MSEYQQNDEQSKISLQINFVSTNVFQIIKIFINFELIIVAAKNKILMKLSNLPGVMIMNNRNCILAP